MKKVKAFIFRASNEITVIMEDGGIASAYNPDGKYYRTDYYQNRITTETVIDNIWDELAEGKMYFKLWDGYEAELITEANDTLVDDMIEFHCHFDSLKFGRCTFLFYWSFSLFTFFLCHM